MKRNIQSLLFIGLSLFSLLVFAGGTIELPPGLGVPEIDAGSAVIGLGLMAGVIALIAERRRK